MDPRNEIATSETKDDAGDAPARRLPGRWIYLVVPGLLLVILLIWGERQVAANLSDRLTKRLSERGWTIEHQGLSWGPIQGVRLEQPKMARTGMPPFLEMSALEIDLPLRALFGGTPRPLGLSSHRAKVLLRDEEGEIELKRVTLEASLREGELQIAKFTARKDGLVADLKGTILIPPQAGPRATQWTPGFRAVRGTLASLRFAPGSEAFKVSGKFQVDARAEETTWKATLNAGGSAVIWQDIPVTESKAEATLSEAGSTITAELELPQGTAGFRVERADWQDSPFLFSGRLTDAEGRHSEFEGNHETGERVWTLRNLKGNADLWAMAENVPALAAKKSRKISVETFPALHVRNARIHRDGGLQVQTILLTSAGKLCFQTKEGRMSLSDLRATLSVEPDGWVLHKATASTLKGRVSAKGLWNPEALEFQRASITAENLDLADLKEVTGHESKNGNGGRLFVNFDGTVDLKKQEANGRGSMRLENAPVFEVPLLDQTFDLFIAMIPEVERARTGRFDAFFIARGDAVEVPRFLATGGSLTVSAKGRIDLEKERIDGVARGKLTGLPGLVTKPLSRLLEMEVGGPFEDIRVKPLGPAKLASNTVSALVGTPVETIEEAGKVTGTIIVEGIKMPFRFLKKKRAEEE